MKRFILFGGPSLTYAEGGMGDILGTGDTLEGCRAIVEIIHKENAAGGLVACDWWHIFDMATSSIVERSELEALGADGVSVPCQILFDDNGRAVLSWE